MKIEQGMVGEVASLTLRGEFDTFYVNDFGRAAETFAERGVANLALNLRNVKFINSTAIGAVIKARRRCKEMGGELAIVQPSKAVSEAIGTLGLGRVIPICDSIEEALEKLGGSPSTTSLGGGNPVMFTIPGEDNEKILGKLVGVGRLLTINPGSLQLRWSPPENADREAAGAALATGSELNLKFRLPFYKKHHYYEVASKVQACSEDHDGNLLLSMNLENLDGAQKQSIQQFVADMNLLREEARGAGSQS